MGDTKVHQATFGHTWTLSPTLILDSTFGFSWQDQQVLTSDLDLGFLGRDLIGLPGTNGGSGRFANDERYAGFPAFNTGFSHARQTSGTIGRANLDGTSVVQDFITVPLVVAGAVYASPAGQPLAAGRATPALALPE